MPDESKKEPFVPKEDRPEVKITMDTPLSELRVRDLSSIVGAGTQKSPFEAGKTSLKDFFDKEFPEVAKNFLKEIKSDKFEKNELKEFKTDKLEKREIKEIKNEKIENDGVFDPGKVVPGPDPDPRFEQLIEAVAGLTKQVSQLSNQVEEIKRKG